MKIIENESFDEERALYGALDVLAKGCRFDGPADGESAFKESKKIECRECYFNLRYPFWHDEDVKIYGSEMTPSCRAAIWYSRGVEIRESRMNGIKALRECRDVSISDCEIDSAELGWFCRGVCMKDTSVKSEYFMLRSSLLNFEGVKLIGKYSLQYAEDSVFEGCEFNTKDSLWHAKRCVVRNSVIRGEYLGWYCEDVTFENCVIIGTQPLCYCKGLRLVNCEMHECDLAFEKSEVDAVVTTPIISVKNPLSGRIVAPKISEIIDEYATKCKVEVTNVDLKV